MLAFEAQGDYGGGGMPGGGMPGGGMGGMGGMPPGAGGGAPRSRSEIEMGKVFVGGLARETTTEGLRGYFERFGDISDCIVMKDRSTGLPRGFGFVTYASQLVADRVVHHRHIVDGKEVEAKPAVPRDSEMLARPGGAPGGMPGMPGMGMSPGFAQPGGLSNMGQGGVGLPLPGAMPGFSQQGGMGMGGANPAESSKKIFVGGLSHETSEADFNAYFGLFGQVVDCVIMCDPHTRKPRGFGFVTYDSTAAVDRACVNKFHELNGKRVEVKRAIPQDRMAAEESASKGMADPNMLAALANNLFGGMGGMPNFPQGGGGGGPNFPGMQGQLDAARFLASQMAGSNNPNANNSFAGGAPQLPGGADNTAQGLDAALSTTNSVLAAMAEPQSDDIPSQSERVPAGILNAFNNPAGSFASASASLSQGARAGYGNGDASKMPPSSQPTSGPMAPGSSQPMGPNGANMTSQGNSAQTQQQEQFRSALLQFQQQQLLLQQVQQRQRQQQQLQQLEQLQNLQQQVLQSQHGPNGSGGHAAGAPAGAPPAAGLLPNEMGAGAPMAAAGANGSSNESLATLGGGAATSPLEQQLMMLSMQEQSHAGSCAPSGAPACSGLSTSAPGNGGTLPGFDPTVNLPHFLS